MRHKFKDILCKSYYTYILLKHALCIYNEFLNLYAMLHALPWYRGYSVFYAVSLFT